MSKQDVEKFRAVVEKDSSLRSQLESQTNVASFVKKAVELGKSRGYNFSADHVNQYLSEKNVALSDEALRSVAGGANQNLGKYTYSKPGCN